MIYDITMFICIVLAISTLWHEHALNTYILWIPWAIFCVDYAVRIFYAEYKWSYIKNHPLDLIALIPLDALFQGAKVIHIYRLLRIKTIVKRYASPLTEIIKEKSTKVIVTLIIAVSLLSTLPFYFYEPSVSSYKEGFLWSIQSIIIFGNSQVEPTTLIGKGLIVFLSIFGICLHTILAAFALQYIKNRVKKDRNDIEI